MDELKDILEFVDPTQEVKIVLCTSNSKELIAEQAYTYEAGQVPEELKELQVATILVPPFTGPTIYDREQGTPLLTVHVLKEGDYEGC